MSRMRGNGHVGDAEKIPGSDFSDFETIEVLQLHLCQDALQRTLYLLFPEKSEIHRLDFRSHEKEIPSRGMDRAIESECIRNRNHAPLSKAGFSFHPRTMRRSHPLFHHHQNRADFYGF